LQAGGIGIGSPLATTVNTAWTGATNVQSAFNSAASVQGLVGVNLADSVGGTATRFDYQTDLTFAINVRTSIPTIYSSAG